jgi:hypothetical protein
MPEQPVQSPAAEDGKAPVAAAAASASPPKQQIPAEDLKLLNPAPMKTTEVDGELDELPEQ